MGGEEKKLLPKNDAGQTDNGQTGMQSHFFPAIQVDRSDNAPVGRSRDDNFQRTRFDQKEGADEISSANSGQHGLGPGRKAAVVDSVEGQIYQEGYKEGFAKGKTEGEKIGTALASNQVKPLVDTLQSGVMQLKNLRQETYRQIEMQVVDLALAIARQVVCREVEMDKEVVICVAREALAKVEDAASINIKMSPSDLQFINETKIQLSDLTNKIDNFTIEAEESVESGGCIIETNQGEIDARIEKQLQAVEESFRALLQSSDES